MFGSPGDGMTAQTRERILPRLIEQEMRESFLDYSMSVIVQRALPDVRDGLKPVHRRILFAMHEAGLRPDRLYKKSATVVGEVLGKYHPHGDTAVYDALVRMVQDFSLRYPLVDGQGNFGSIDGDSAAAYRYTEAKLAPIAEDILADIEKETVDVIENFDGQRTEPTVLPSRVPNLLINGSSGIAVGLSTNVPPHNLREVAAALRALIEEPDPTLDVLMKHLPGPDFPTGGFVIGCDGIRDMYETGRGRIIMRARIVKEALRGGRGQLVVTELPYAVSKARIIRQIADLARKGGVVDLSDIRDESDRDGLRLVLELKRGAKAGKVIKLLLKKTSLQSTFGAIMIALDHGEPKEFTLVQLLERFRDHRVEVIQRRSQHDLEKAQAEKHIAEGLVAALGTIDEVIEIIRGSADRSEASEKLQDLLGLSEIQADAILNMRLAKLTSLEQAELKRRLKELRALIRGLKEILKSEARKLEIMLEELDEIVEKYGDARRTILLEDDESDEMEVENTVADEDAVITVSHEGFVKRIPMHLYRRRVSSGKPLAGMERFENDYLERIFVARTQSWLLAFTENGHLHFLPVLDVPEGGRASRGQSIYALTQADRSDAIVTMLAPDDLTVERFVVFLTKNGLMKRTKLSDFANPRSGGVIAAGLKAGDRIMDVRLSDGEGEVMLITKAGRAIRFPESDLSVLGRTAQGVKGIDLKGDDSVVGMLLIRRDAWVLSVTEDGKGKRTEVSDFPLQKRGGLGTMAVPTGDATVPGAARGTVLVSALEVLEGDEVMVVMASGQVTRLRADEVRAQGRRTQGRPLVRPAADDRVVEVTRAYSENVGAKSEVQAGNEGNEGRVGQLDLLG
ncbi:MAG TPA: DNA gyrase subunit A [Gemmatimonadetes bacterium]|nr:DNA gyrase subunit A [Gemmatimonadota bacterium]